MPQQNQPTGDQSLPVFIPERKPYTAYEDAITLRQLHFYISGPIEEPEHYTEMIHQIRSASQNDVVHIHLNTPGGMVATGVQIINAIDNSEALVVTHLEGEVCSMGSLIFLAGHQMVAYQYSLLMFHNYSGGVSGKGHEQKAALDASEKWYSSIQDTLCTPFLTKAELKRIKDGQDLWLLHDDIKKRLDKMQKAFEKEAAEQEQLESVELTTQAL
jgi:ATP-dependent protease ClpP protease subunit